MRAERWAPDARAGNFRSSRDRPVLQHDLLIEDAAFVGA